MGYLLILHLSQRLAANVRLLFSFISYETKRRTLQDKFYIPTIEEDSFEKVKLYIKMQLTIERSANMMIFLQNKLTVLATPKTGSTALHMALGQYSDLLFRNAPAAKHISPFKYKNELSSFVDNLAGGPCETLAVIREPLEWLGSWYRYRSRHEAANINSTKAISFDQFVFDYLSDDRPQRAKVGAQSRFLRNPENNNLTYLWRYDHMDSLQMFLSLRLGRKFELEHKNVSPLMDLSISPENKSALLDYFTPDYDLYETAIGKD